MVNLIKDYRILIKKIKFWRAETLFFVRFFLTSETLSSNMVKA